MLRHFRAPARSEDGEVREWFKTQAWVGMVMETEIFEALKRGEFAQGANDIDGEFVRVIKRIEEPAIVDRK